MVQGASQRERRRIYRRANEAPEGVVVLFRGWGRLYSPSAALVSTTSVSRRTCNHQNATGNGRCTRTRKKENAGSVKTTGDGRRYETWQSQKPLASDETNEAPVTLMRCGERGKRNATWWVSVLDLHPQQIPYRGGLGCGPRRLSIHETG